MNPDNYQIAIDSSMSPLAILMTGALILALLVLFRSRQTAAATIIAAVCYLPQTEALNLGFHFYAIRLVLLAGIIRVFIRGEYKGFRWGRVDRALVTYALVIITMASIRAPAELTYRLGNLYDILLGYFTFRCLIRNETDLRLILSKTAYVLVPFAGLMFYESFTNHNPFAVFHGVLVSSEVRYAHVRATGTFRNPITAGSFGATFAMFYASLLFARLHTRSALLGLAASVVIVYSAHATGPFLGLGLGIVSFAFWRFRHRTKQILWGFVGLLLVLQLAMNKPVWFLIGRASGIAGGGGWHRSELIEKAVEHFDRWWFAGTVDTVDWFPYQLADYGVADITNWFIAAAVIAGLLGLLTAILLMVVSFQTLSRTLAARRGKLEERFVWGIGSTLVATIGIFFSITYMDQMQVIFYFLLASIAALATYTQPVPMPVREIPARILERVPWREKLGEM
jgi:hypothetical protein